RFSRDWSSDVCSSDLGRALVSVVGFRFLDTRVLGAAIPCHRSFDEVNLRCYVRRDAPGGETRRGVVFVRELVSRAAVALVARLEIGRASCRGGGSVRG